MELDISYEIIQFNGWMGGAVHKGRPNLGFCEIRMESYQGWTKRSKCQGGLSRISVFHELTLQGSPKNIAKPVFVFTQFSNPTNKGFPLFPRHIRQPAVNFQSD